MYWEIGIKAISALFQGFLLICLDVGLCLIFIVLLLSMASAYCNFLLFFPLLYLCVSLSSVKFSSVQSLSCVRLFATPWIATSQASLSITNSQSSPKLMSIQSMMPSSHLILYCPLLLLPPNPSQHQSFPMSQLFAWGGQSTGVSALASFPPKKSQGWSPSE